MSPEQIRRASKIDASADVWSLGVVLFECLCGRQPWDDSESIGTLMAAILTREVPLIQDRAPWVAPELAAVVERALARDPTRRLRTAAEFRDALRAIVSGGPRLTLAELVPPPERERTSIAPRVASAVAFETTQRPESLRGASASVPPRSRTALGLTAVLLLMAVGGGVWTLARSNESRHAVAPSIVASAAPKVDASARQLYLAVAPPEALATVDGVPVTIVGQRILIEGALGSAHTVRLTRAGNTAEWRVAITAEGLLPPRLELPVAAGPASSSSRTPAKSALERSAAKRRVPPPVPPPDPPPNPPATRSANPSLSALDDKFD
jgi:serine/threonine-protein kinase